MQEQHNPEERPPVLEITKDMIEHLPSDLHKAIARDYVSRGYWRLIE